MKVKTKQVLNITNYLSNLYKFIFILSNASVSLASNMKEEDISLKRSADNEKEEIPSDIGKGLKLAYENTMIAKMPEDIRNRYDTQDTFFSNYTQLTKEIEQRALNQGKAEGIAQGVVQGQRLEKFNLAKKLLDMNMSESDIAKATDLSLEEVQNLKIQDK